MTKPRQYHYGGVPRSLLQASINATDELGLLIVIGASEATAWPTVGPYVVRIERGTPREEAFMVSGRSGNNLLVVERGYDDTTAVAHTAGSVVFVEHTFDGAWPNTVDGILALPTTAGDLLVSNGTNYLRLPVGTNGQVPVADSGQPARMRWGVNPVSDLVVAAGDMLYGTGVDVLARLPVGTTAYPLTVVGGLPAWARLTGAGLADDSVGSQHYVDGSIQTAHIAPATITGPLIAPGAVGPSQLAPAARADIVAIDSNESYAYNTVTPTDIWTLPVPAGTLPGTVYDLEAFGWLSQLSGARRYYYLRVGHGGNYVEFLVSATNRAGMYHWHVHQRLVVVSASLYHVFVRYEHTHRDPGDTTDGATMIENGSLTSPIQFLPTVQWAASRGTVDLTGAFSLNGQLQMVDATNEQTFTCLNATVTRITS